MKTINNYFKYFTLALSLVMVATACGDEGTIDPPLAFFTYVADASNPQIIQFSNESQGGETYAWNFGDDNTSTDASPAHEYSAGGTYTVSLTVTNGGGTNTYTEYVLVAAANMLENGSMDDNSAWTVINFYECTNQRGEVSFADGVALFAHTAQAEDGGWKHMGLYQEVTLEAGTYAADAVVDYDGIDSVWGEIYVGQTMPVACTDEEGTDYGDNRILFMFNAWDCNASYTGSAVENGCNTTKEVDGVMQTFDGTFEVETAGTYYFVMKIGGGNYGANGIKVDDVTLYKQ